MAKMRWYDKLCPIGEQKIVSTFVTPDMAIEALSANTNNRKVMPRRVALLVAEIESSRWCETGNTIKFSRDGELIDGQHRLHAIVKSGIGLRLNVALGLDPDTKPIVDAIMPRKASENIHIAGYANATTLGSLTRLAIPYFRGDNPFSYRGTRAFAFGEIKEWIEDNSDCHAAATSAISLKQIMPISVAAFCLLVFRRLDAELSEEWRVKMQTGAGLIEGSTWHLLRRRLEADRMSRKKEAPEQTCGVCFLAWNAKRKGRELGVIRYVPDEDRSKFIVAV